MKTKGTLLSIAIGVFLVALGIIVSAEFLDSTIFLQGTIAGTDRRAPAWMVIRVLLVLAGLYLLVRRPTVSVKDLAFMAAVAAIAAGVGAVAVQFVLSATPVVSGWRSFAPADQQNSLGFRGRPISYSDTDFVVVLVGDSQVESMSMDMDSMPETRLEHYLKTQGVPARVFSVAAGGYGQDQQLIGLEDFFGKFRADLVVLWETPANDIWNNQFLTNMFSWHSKPSYWLEGGELRGPTAGVGEQLCASKFVLVAMWCQVVSLPHRARTWERRLPSPFVPLDHWDGAVNLEWQQRWDSNRGFMRDENLATEQSHMAIDLTPASKRMEYGIELTRALLFRIKALAEAHGAGFVAFQTVGRRDPPITDGMYLLNGKYYQVSDRQAAAIWRKVNSGLDSLDVSVAVDEWKVAPDDAHLNKAATDQVMRDLADQLMPHISQHVRAQPDASD